MATNVLLDRGRNATATTGTGNITLGAAPPGFITLNGVGIGSTFPYVIEDNGPIWEVGIGTLSATNTVARTTIYATSAGNTSPITLTGNAVIYCSLIAENLPQIIANALQAAVTAGLFPTTLPSTAGILWIDGQGFAIS